MISKRFDIETVERTVTVEVNASDTVVTCKVVQKDMTNDEYYGSWDSCSWTLHFDAANLRRQAVNHVRDYLGHTLI